MAMAIMTITIEEPLLRLFLFQTDFCNFPIACCIVLGWYIKLKDDKYNAQIEKMTEAHKEESKQFADALNNNTLVIQKLVDKMEDK